MKFFTLAFLLIASNFSYAGWHQGKLGIIAFGYDGKTISVGQEGFTKTDCTCYPAWPSRYCLDATRDTFKEEYAFLLSIKARDKPVDIYIDDTTCKIEAMYER